MMLSFLYWHLLHSFLSWGFKSQGNSTTEKKNCVSEMTVEVRISLVVLDAILRNLRVSPYNRAGAIISFPPESAASSFWGLGKLQMM